MSAGTSWAAGLDFQPEQAPAGANLNSGGAAPPVRAAGAPSGGASWAKGLDFQPVAAPQPLPKNPGTFGAYDPASE